MPLSPAGWCAGGRPQPRGYVWGQRELLCCVCEITTLPRLYNRRAGADRTSLITSKETSLLFPVSGGERLCSWENNAVWAKIKSVH